MTLLPQSVPSAALNLYWERTQALLDRLVKP